MLRPSPKDALIRGHLTVTLPVLLIILAAPVIGWLAGGGAGLLLGVVTGSGFAWPWWSFAVPRWRDWVIDNGLSPEDVQDTAEAIGLLWPRGSRWERTEFPRRNGRKGW